MTGFTCRMELSESDPPIVTKMHCLFEPWKTMNEVQAFLEDLQQGAKEEGEVDTVIEEMRRDASNQLYIRIGFRRV